MVINSEGSYVRVFGNLRPTPGGRSVVGFQLLPITDFNEITFHYLEVIAVHLRNTQGVCMCFIFFCYRSWLTLCGDE
jgi:hypothetical protein